MTVDAQTVKLAGPALWGAYSVADYAIDLSFEAKEFADLQRRLERSAHVLPALRAKKPLLPKPP